MKRLKDRIAENMKDKKPCSRNTQLAFIISIKDEIREAVDFGWSIKDIWKQLVLEKKLNNCCYSTFVRNWNKIKKLTRSEIKADEGVTLTPEKKIEESAGPKFISIKPNKTFSYENFKKEK